MLRLLLQHSNFTINVHEMLMTFQSRIGGFSVWCNCLLICLKHKMRTNLRDASMQLFTIILLSLWLLGFDVFTKVRGASDSSLLLNIVLFLMIKVILNELHGVIVIIANLVIWITFPHALLRILLPSSCTRSDNMIIMSLRCVDQFARALSCTGLVANTWRWRLRCTSMITHTVNNHLSSCAVSAPGLFSFRFIVTIIVLCGTCLKKTWGHESFESCSRRLHGRRQHTVIYRL